MLTPDGRVLDLFFIINYLGLLQQMSRILKRLLLKVMTWVSVTSPRLGCLGTAFHYCWLKQGGRLRSLDSRMALSALWPSFVHQPHRDHTSSSSSPP
ncbi:hypothetical protein D8674_003472 [Pyrus ussuriensis x Pyrus communis]|uniref:Uncharacterized protein n=1 Tax=Pyrus ussuriensis x Pyrus communis TaxID=2448454 RepID=A0A5N5FHR4_9ROSA|nr:hypothetical protein D8674_003472 [Pyrus ussuriensis x Pyrus communis]